MLRKRLIVVIFMVPIIAIVAVVGGTLFSIVIAVVVGLGAWEFWRMFRKGGYSPSAAVLIGGAVLLALRSHISYFDMELLATMLLMLAMTVHLLGFERGDKRGAIDFCITLGGILYLGLLGGFFIKLRALPDGLWWLLVVLPAAWFADLGGYFAGRWFGRHPLAPRLSPKKTREGYIGGIVLGILGTGLMGALWHLRAVEITAYKGFLLGGILSLVLPLGDLGESMLKRQFDIKDSSNLLPGHGGILDRIDTWLWAAAIGFYLVFYIV